MSAALSLGNQGFSVHLVEKSEKLGGRLDDAASEVLVEKTERHPLISVHANSRLVELKGHVGNFTSVIQMPEGDRSITHGVILVATGAEEHKPSEYLYGEDARVLTQRELESRLLFGTLNLPEHGTWR